MYSRWFNVTVVILWLITTTWLVYAKVLPALLVGQPPNYASILREQLQEPPAGWRIAINGRRVGWSTTQAKRLPEDLTEIENFVHFDSLSFAEVTPEFILRMLRVSGQERFAFQIDAQSSFLIDPLGRLSRFDSVVYFGDLASPVRIEGSIDERKLRFSLRHSGRDVFDKELAVPEDALIGDALSPQVTLPGLRIGQSWTVPIFSPLKPINEPLEIFTARVDRREPLSWNGRNEQTFVVVYHRDPGSGFQSSQEATSRLWVASDGQVLKHETTLFGTTLVFNRLTDEEAESLTEEALRIREKHRNRRGAGSALPTIGLR